MPGSQPKPEFNAEVLRNYLAETLPHSKVFTKQKSAELEPLVFLQTNHLVAGFALSNGDYKASYEKLYHDFKGQFKNELDFPNSTDVAFVFCIQPDRADLEQFCSNVETDVYFCRKFVVPLAVPFRNSLARLPFLPLAPLSGTTLRPPSAQTFLSQFGVPSVLARHIVVQRERGAERIIEDCVVGTYGQLPELSNSKALSSIQPDASTESVKLETVTIKNFRAYRQAQTFSLGADVTVLYGPNGFGKTSFFDAVDFAVTGGIGRLEVAESQFAEVAKHLDSNTEDGEVSVTFSSDGGVRRVTRKVINRKDAVLDGISRDRKAILAELTGRDIPATDRVENFVNLFRATHLFNQESQELTKGFHADCCLPAEIVSRMLAFQDYTNAISKTGKICDLLESFVADAKREIDQISLEVSDEKTSLLRLTANAKSHSDPDALAKEFLALKEKLDQIGISTIAGPPSLETTRFWRASIETRLGDSQNCSEQLSQILDALPPLNKARTELPETQKQLAKRETELLASDKIRLASDEALKGAERKLSEVNASLGSARAKLALLEWHKVNKPVYLELVAKTKLLNEDFTKIALEIQKFRAAEELVDSELKSLELALQQISSQIGAKRNVGSIVTRLIDELPVWQANQKRQASFAEVERGIQSTIKALSTKELELLPELAKTKETLSRLTHQVAQVDKNQTELKVLLSQLQSHVESGTCPLCGQEHGDKQELLRRIQLNLQSDSASGARVELGSMRERSSRLEAELADVKQKQQAATEQIAALKSEEIALDVKIKNFLGEVTALGLAVDEPGVKIPELLSSFLADTQRELSTLNGQLKNAGDSVEAAKTKKSVVKNDLTKQLSEEASKKAQVTRNSEELAVLRNDVRSKEFSLDADNDQWTREENNALEQITKLKVEIESAQEALLKFKASQSTARESQSALKDQVQVLRSALANHQKVIAQSTGKLEQAKVPAEITETQLLELIAQETRHKAQLEAFRASATNLELALDAVTTAAALVAMQQSIRNKEKIVATATVKRDQNQPLLTYFSRISRLLSNQQNESIANFTKEYGPRTSVIQRRLRSVYGFDDLEILSRESTIRVRVKRNGQELRPTDYFSQSQQQTLLLGLFLTACISQTWSGFSPIFMDDPVTHFDDLNTYAFLDLVIGLLESDSCKRQFIISTCDDKLLQLAIQKFGHLGDRAVFYRFDAIGSNGPVVEKINQS
ncbi:MAG: SMC family ATPase [Deltaproteobacteria bacterium]